MAQAAGTAQPDLHGRQRLLPMAQRRAAGRHRSHGRGCRNGRRRPGRAAGPAYSDGKLPAVGTRAAHGSPRAGGCQRRAVPPAAGRGGGGVADGHSGVDRAGGGLAPAAVSGRDGRGVRGRLCPGGHLWAAGGACPEHPAGPWAGPRGPRAGTRHRHWRRAARFNGRCGQPGRTENLPRHPGPSPGRRGLGRHWQGRPRRLAVLLRALPGSLRQRPAPPDRLLLHTPRRRS